MKWSLNYIAITNSPEEAIILDQCGIQQIMIDTEILGKVDRQKGKQTIISDHKIEDVIKLKELQLNLEIICRINSFNENIFNEIDQAILAGADFIMIPMIKNIEEYKLIVDHIDKRMKIIPLIETTYSLFNLKSIIEYSNIKQIHFGLNDLFIDIGYKNLFEILFSEFFSYFINFAVNNVEVVGIGGIGNPKVPLKVDSLLLLSEFLNLKSSSIILSRSFFKNGYDKQSIIEGLRMFEDVFKDSKKYRNLDLLKEQVQKLN